MEPASGIQPDLGLPDQKFVQLRFIQAPSTKVQPGKVGSLRLDELHAGQLFLQEFPDVIQIFQQIGLALGQPFLSALIGRLAGNGPQPVDAAVMEPVQFFQKCLPHRG